MTFKEPMRVRCGCRDCKARRSVKRWTGIEKFLRMVKVKQ